MSLGRFSTFVIVLTAFFGSSFGLNIIPDYFMNSGGLGNCGETINNKEDVYIRSHTGAYQLGSIINYGANENCELTFNAGTGKKVLIKFLEFELENAAGNECLDGLKIFDHQNTTTSTNSNNATVSYNCTINNNATIDNCTAANNCSLDNCTVANNCSIENTTLTTNLCTMENSSSLTNQITADLTVCGSAGPSPFVSDSSEVQFKFYTNSLNHFSGFQLLVTSFREADNCSSNEFQCDTNRCIPSNLKCDTVQHCVDGTDENDDIAGCTIFDKILGYVFGLGQLTVITIAILGGVIIFTIITFIIVYHVCCKKKHNRVHDTQEALPGTSRNTHIRESRKGQKGKRTVTVVAPAPHTSEAIKSTKKPASGRNSKSKKRSDEENDPFW